jgi:hypothetical protein
MRRAIPLAPKLALVLALLVPMTTAAMAQAVVPRRSPPHTVAKMSAAFAPLRLGSPTAVSFAFKIAAHGSPALLTGVRLAYPPNLGFATSGLGIASCSPNVIEELGPTACPANSRMGSGSATVQVPFGPFLVKENVHLLVFAGPSTEGFLQLLISAVGEEPVSAHLILSAELRDGQLAVTVPPIPSLPEGPYVSITNLGLTIGGPLTYYERRHGRIVAYRPPGVGLPTSCPRRGFSFAATFTFLDGSSTGARTAVRCPVGRP